MNAAAVAGVNAPPEPIGNCDNTCAGVQVLDLLSRQDSPAPQQSLLSSRPLRAGNAQYLVLHFLEIFFGKSSGCVCNHHSKCLLIGTWQKAYVVSEMNIMQTKSEQFHDKN